MIDDEQQTSDQQQTPGVDQMIAQANDQEYNFEHSNDRRSPAQWIAGVSKKQKIILGSSVVLLALLFTGIWLFSSHSSNTTRGLNAEATKSVTSGPAASSAANDDTTNIIANASTSNPEDNVSDVDDEDDTNSNDAADSDSADTTDSATGLSWWQKLLNVSKNSSNTSSSTSNSTSKTGTSSADSSSSDEDTGEVETITTTLQNVSYTKMKTTSSPTGGTKYTNGKKDSGGSVIDTMQGGTTDGTYLYFAYANPAGGGTIAKFDFNGTLIKGSGVYGVSALGHANALAYDSRRHRLIMPTFRVEGNNIVNGAKLAYIDPSTLQVTQYVNVQPKATISNICYNPATDQFAANGRLYDADFNLKNKSLYKYGSAVLKKYGDGNSFGQGIACNTRYIYVIRYYADTTKPHTHVYMFNWSGKLLSVYNVKDLNDESESIFIANGQLYMGVNNGSTYLGKSSDNKNDYFIRLNGLPL